MSDIGNMQLWQGVWYAAPLHDGEAHAGGDKVNVGMHKGWHTRWLSKAGHSLAADVVVKVVLRANQGRGLGGSDGEGEKVWSKGDAVCVRERERGLFCDS